jgi:hypothetical protein
MRWIAVADVMKKVYRNRRGIRRAQTVREAA